jgi:MFS family permease
MRRESDQAYGQDSPPRLRVLEALRHRDFRLLWIGQTISQIGDAAFVVALGWRAFTLTHSASSLGIVLMVEALAGVTTLLIGGVIADRYSRRALVIGSDLGRAAVVTVLATLDATGDLSFAVLIVLVALHGLGSGLFQPAFRGILPSLVETHALTSANALISVTQTGSFIVGPALAAPIYAGAGSSTVFAVDAASFLLSSVILLPARPRAYARPPVQGLRSELAEGFRYIASVPWLWRTIATLSIVLMVGHASYQVLLPKLVRDAWGGGVGSYGFLFTLQGLGLAAGAVAAGQADLSRARGPLIYSAFSFNSILGVLQALSPWYEGAAALSVGRGFCVGLAFTVFDTMLMQRVPGHLLSRVISVDFFGELALLPAGLGIWAALSSVADPRTLIAASSSVCALLFLLGLADRRIRAVD